MAEGDWQRLGRVVTSERARLGYRTRREFSRASGLSERLLYAVEHAERSNFDEPTLAALEFALGWTPGSVERALAGGTPRRVDPEFATVRRCWPKMSEDARRMLARLAEEAAGLR